MFKKVIACISIVTLMVTLCTAVVYTPQVEATPSYVLSQVINVDCYEYDASTGWIAYCTSYSFTATYEEYPDASDHYIMGIDENGNLEPRHLSHSENFEKFQPSNQSYYCGSCSECDS